MMVELNSRLYNKLREEAPFWKSKGGVRLILVCTANPDLMFGLFQAKTSVSFWTLCSSSPFDWLFFVQISRSSAITSISQNPPRSESLQQIPLPHWNKSEFCQRFQQSQDFTSTVFFFFLICWGNLIFIFWVNIYLQKVILKTSLLLS